MSLRVVINLGLAFLLALVINIGAAQMKPFVDFYCNPLDVSIGDPFVFQDGGFYYLYGTTWPYDGFNAWKSKDLITWQGIGPVFSKTTKTWSQYDQWAPEVIKHGNFYYMFFSSSNDANTGSKRICVARSSSPDGPFAEFRAPLFEGKAVIDAHPFVDHDGQAYLFYVLDCSENGISEIYVTRLSDTLDSIEGPRVLCVTPSQKWEGAVWNEGPYVFRHKDFYYLMYSANAFNDPYYQVGYAWSRSPLGPWTKYQNNPVLKITEQSAGCGHNSVTRSPDGSELFIVYHRHSLPKKGFQSRLLSIDRIKFVPAKPGEPDILTIVGPTHVPTQLPSGSKGINWGKSDCFETENLDRQRWFIFNETPGLWQIKDGGLHITAVDGDIYQNRVDAKNIFFEYIPYNNFRISVTIEFAPAHDYQQAFLSAYQDSDNYIKCALVPDSGEKIEVARELNGDYEKIIAAAVLPGTKQLMIIKRGTTFECCYKDGNSDWKSMGSTSLNLDRIRLAIGAIAPKCAVKSDCVFKNIKIEQL